MTPRHPPQQPRAVLFDVYGTLLDVHSVAALAEQIFPQQGRAVSTTWRDTQIAYTRLLTTSADATGHVGAHYKPFSAVTQDALRQTCANLGLLLSADHEAALMRQYHRLSAFPEVKPTLMALRDAGVTTGVLSNGDPEMLGSALRHAGLTEWLDHVISADTVRLYKTHPAVYALGPATVGPAAADILFVSANGWDALGATWFGYTTLWVNRAQGQPESLGPPPTRIGRSLSDVAQFFPDLPLNAG